MRRYGIVRRLFSLIETLIIASILLIIISLLSPALGRMIEFSHQTTCQNNLKSFSNAHSIYSEDHSFWFPLHGNLAWKYEVKDYLGVEFESRKLFRKKNSQNTIFNCASYKYDDEKAVPLYGGYASSRYFGRSRESLRVHTSRISIPTETIVVGDGMDYIKDSIRYHILYNPGFIPWHYDHGYGEFKYTRHQGSGLNLMWVDGHVSYQDWWAFSQGKKGDIDYFYKINK